MNEMLMSMPTTGTLIHAELAIRQLLSYALFVLTLPMLVATWIPSARQGRADRRQLEQQPGVESPAAATASTIQG